MKVRLPPSFDMSGYDAIIPAGNAKKVALLILINQIAIWTEFKILT
jgi:hypothetical protein